MKTLLTNNKLMALLLLAAPALARAEIKTETVEYKQDGTVMEGYLAYDTAAKGKSPGVVIVHEWTGLGDYAQSRARQLAGLGYVAFAADIYGKGIRANSPAEAGKLAGKYKSDRKLLRARVNAALDTLKTRKEVDASKIAAIGYCFGGTTVLELARSGANLRGVVSFHGGLDSPTPDDAKNIKAKVLVLHGADDPNVPPAQVAAFEDEMRNAHVDWQLKMYGGAVHSFTNPASGNDNSKGVAYNAAADKRSFKDMTEFFDEIFR